MAEPKSQEKARETQKPREVKPGKTVPVKFVYRLAYCVSCQPVSIVAAGHFCGTPTHRVKGQVHTSKVIEIDEETEPSKDSKDLFKRLSEKYKDRLK